MLDVLRKVGMVVQRQRVKNPESEPHQQECGYKLLQRQ